jgi:hypothetical protein
MNLGNILNKIIERKAETYKLQYGSQFDSFFTNINEIPNVKSLKIDPILIITDQSPHSLISIAYMVRIAEALGKETNVYALTEKKHSDAIKEVCKEYKIQLQDVKETINPTIDEIKNYVMENNIGLVIISYAHKMKLLILEQVSVTVLISSIKNI